MLRTLALVTTLALADSLNPSTVIPGLYLATHQRGPGPLLSFTGGVFSVTFAGGVLLLLGPGQLALGALPHPDETAKSLLELSLGVLALGAGALLWLRRDRPLRAGSRGLTGRKGAVFALGAGIMAVELPTALPYFAAIAVIVGGVDPLSEQIALLSVFNVLFVLPLLLLAAARFGAGERTERLLARLDAWLRRRANLLMATVVLAGGVALTVAGLVELVAG
ncbi:MAG: GAP family protein [Actinomycetota bacterium]|nr:GAP family protein [Actinomycetota bacterium]